MRNRILFTLFAPRGHTAFSKFGLPICIFIVLVISSQWLVGIKEVPIDLDEVAWVNDAKVFEWRVTNQWNKFTWSTKNQHLSWTSPDFRLFDQPHLVKYIYGAVLSGLEIKPWASKHHQHNLILFTQQSLSGKLMLDDMMSIQVFGKETVQAIWVCRIVSVFFSLLFFILLFFFLSHVHTTLLALVTTVWLMTNSVFGYSLRIATADSISLTFVLLSCIMFYYLFWKRDIHSKNYTALYLFSAFSSALSAAAKINGWILVIIFSLLSMQKLFHTSHSDFKKFLFKFISWFMVFLGVYLLLQPELWKYPFEGIFKFFSQRYHQQQAFYAYFGSLGFFDFHRWIFELFIQSRSTQLLLPKMILLLVSVAGYFKLIFQKSFRKNKNVQKTLLFAVLTWVMVFFYARVGFVQYGEWLLVIMACIVSYGCTEFVYIVWRSVCRLK